MIYYGWTHESDKMSHAIVYHELNTFALKFSKKGMEVLTQMVVLEVIVSDRWTVFMAELCIRSTAAGCWDERKKETFLSCVCLHQVQELAFTNSQTI